MKKKMVGAVLLTSTFMMSGLASTAQDAETETNKKKELIKSIKADVNIAQANFVKQTDEFVALIPESVFKINLNLGNDINKVHEDFTEQLKEFGLSKKEEE